MSSGALVNLVSKGVQDAFIIGDPQVSFFRQNYKRHTNFSMKPVELPQIGNANRNGEFRCRISDIGDLVTYMWLDVESISRDPPNSTSNVSAAQENPSQFELRIGGKTIDTQDAFFTDSLWSKFLATTPAKKFLPSTATGTSTCFLPLHFFHCDENTTPLPLVALQYHECELIVRPGPFVAENNRIRVYANAIFLDKEDRDWFVNNQHDILITQTQTIVANQNGSDLSYLNHPVKALLWGSEDEDVLVTSNTRLTINGTDVFDNPMPGKYFNSVQTYMHSENSDLSTLAGSNSSLYMHSFAQFPSRHQPTGTLNFSRLDNARIKWNLTTGLANGDVTKLYAVNYNILTIKNGMAGVKFSN